MALTSGSTFARVVTVLLLAFFVSASADTFVELTSVGASPIRCYVDGELQPGTNNQAHTRDERAVSLALEHPGSHVQCDRYESIVARVTAAGRALISGAYADVLVGEQSDYPDPVLDEEVLILDEDFSTAPLADDQNPYYDDGTDYDQGTMPVSGSPALEYRWSEGGSGTNGLINWRAHFLDSNGDLFPQSEFEVEFDFAVTSNFPDVSPGTKGPHVWYLRTNLDGLYGDNTTLYLEPDGDGNWWIDINKSDQPSTWEEVRQDDDLDTYDGAVHHVKLYIKENDYGSSNGIIRVWVDDTLVVEDTSIEILIYENQHFQNISFGPYIGLGTNDATGEVAMWQDNLVVRSITPATSNESVEPGTFEFSQASYSVAEDTGTLSVAVNRTNGTSGAATVHVGSSDGTATSGADYTAVDQTLSYADGESSKSINVTVASDEEAEGSESFSLSLSSATGGASVGSIGDTTITILDSTATEPGSLSVDWPVTAYADDELVFTVRIPETHSSDVPFDYATSNSGSGDGFAAAGTDYTATSGSSSIPAGSLYKQIAVPIAGNTPPTGRDEFTFTVTDADENDTVVKGLIMNAITIYSYDYPSVGAATKQGWYRSNQTGSWGLTNLKAVHPGNPTIGSTVPCAVGVNCLRHNMIVSDGGQGDVGLDTLANINIGGIFDGEDYYYKWYMKIEPGFEWESVFPPGPNNQEKMKACRVSRTSGTNPIYTTCYIDRNGLWWEWSFPESNGSSSKAVHINYDFEGIDSEWHEYIWHQKRESSYSLTDGESHFVVDCVLVDTKLNTVWTEHGFTLPSNTSAQMGHGALLAYFESQIGLNGETTGGIIYTDGHMATQGIWPTARCDRPW